MTLFCAVNSKSHPVIGLLREGKNPPDKRVPLSPTACRQLLKLWPNTRIVVQPSSIRCFSETAYAEAGCAISEDLSACNLLMGVKEVQINDLIPDKTHLFLVMLPNDSHTTVHYCKRCCKKGSPYWIMSY